MRILIKNAGGLLNVCEDHLHVYPLTCFSWASHAVVRINNFIRVLQTCDRSHGLVVDAVLRRALCNADFSFECYEFLGAAFGQCPMCTCFV